MARSEGAPSKMLAAQYDAYGTPDVLQMRSVARPAIRPGQVLARVAASSVNGADTTFRSGRLKVISGNRFPRGCGFDFAGDVVEVGNGVSGVKAGDGVWGFVNRIRNTPVAAVAEYVLAPAECIAPRPNALSAADSAALPGAAGAALGVLRDVIGVRPGEKVLVRGAGGGVGTAAVQIARAFGGEVTALVRASQLDMVRELGAQHAFDYRDVNPSSLGRFDVIVDPVGRNMRSFRPLLTPHGRMAAMIVGSIGDAAYMMASAVFAGRRVRFVQSPPTGAILSDLAEMVDAGSLRPVIAATYEMANIADAHRAFEAGGNFGKLVVTVSDSA